MKKTFDLQGKQIQGTDGWKTGIKCWICYSVSWEPEHVRQKYCPKCRFFHSLDWQNDPLVKLKIATDPVFTVKLYRAVKMYRWHWLLVGLGLNLARLLRSMLPGKKTIKKKSKP